IDEATIELLLAEARGSEGALPLLEFALTDIFTGMLAGKAPAHTLRTIGGVGGALAVKAREIYEQRSEIERTIIRRALCRLVQLGEGTRDPRRRLPIRELCGRGDSETEVLAVLRYFATQDARLVTLRGQDGTTEAEVTHEALFDHFTELRTWLAERR